MANLNQYKIILNWQPFMKGVYMVYQLSKRINYSAYKTQLRDLQTRHAIHTSLQSWLPVKFRTIFKVILCTFKSVHGIAPSYIDSLLSLKQSRYNVRSVGNNTLTRSEIKSAKTTGDRAFVVAAPVLGLLITLLHSRNN